MTPEWVFGGVSVLAGFIAVLIRLERRITRVETRLDMIRALNGKQ